MMDLSDLGLELGTSFLAVCTAFGLAAACGLRVFLPLFLGGLAARLEFLSLHEHFGWLGSTIALVVFGLATLLEILSYHVPLLDHALDVAATSVAAIAGAILSLAVLADFDPWLRWSLALMVGTSLPTAIRLPVASTRVASTVTTAGIGNQLIAVGESVGATLLAGLAVLVPFVVVPLILALVVAVWVQIRRRRRRATN